MLNQVVVVGRLVQDPEIKELENGQRVSNITLAVSRCYKNEEGIYETDFISCKLWNNIADNVKGYCKKGDIARIKGRLQVREGKLEVVAEKVTFLSNRKENE